MGAHHARTLRGFKLLTYINSTSIYQSNIQSAAAAVVIYEQMQHQIQTAAIGVQCPRSVLSIANSQPQMQEVHRLFA